MQVSNLGLLAAAVVSFYSLTLNPVIIVAQDSKILNGEGVAGDIDIKGRGPALSVGTENIAASTTEPARTRILVDARVSNTAYDKYPVRFDFYVNRKLFSSQIRSPELPGAIGVDVGRDVATLPFNYTVVGTVLTPNREFTSVVQGAVFETSLSSKLDCTLTVSGTEADSETIYTADGVDTSQVSSDSLSLKFEAKADSGTANIEGSLSLGSSSSSSSSSSGDVSATATVTKDAKGTFTISRDDKTEDSALSGTVTVENDALKSLDVSSSDGNTTLACS